MKSYITFAILGRVAVMLVASAAAATEDVFAGKKKKYDQALYQANAWEMVSYHGTYSVQIVHHRFKAMGNTNDTDSINAEIATKGDNVIATSYQSKIDKELECFVIYVLYP